MLYVQSRKVFILQNVHHQGLKSSPSQNNVSEHSVHQETCCLSYWMDYLQWGFAILSSSHFLFDVFVKLWHSVELSSFKQCFPAIHDFKVLNWDAGISGCSHFIWISCCSVFHPQAFMFFYYLFSSTRDTTYCLVVFKVNIQLKNIGFVFCFFKYLGAMVAYSGVFSGTWAQLAPLTSEARVRTAVWNPFLKLP